MQDKLLPNPLIACSRRRHSFVWLAACAGLVLISCGANAQQRLNPAPPPLSDFTTCTSTPPRAGVTTQERCQTSRSNRDSPDYLKPVDGNEQRRHLGWTLIKAKINTPQISGDLFLVFQYAADCTRRAVIRRKVISVLRDGQGAMKPDQSRDVLTWKALPKRRLDPSFKTHCPDIVPTPSRGAVELELQRTDGDSPALR